MRALVLISIGLNLALLGALAWRESRPAPAAHSPPPREPAATIVTQEVEAPVRTAAPIAVTNLTRAEFRWALVANTELRQYRDNLRAIGCPENTLRDILTAEVDHVFGQRRRDLLAPMQAQFWQWLAQGKGPDAFMEPIEELSEERSKVLMELLGKKAPEKETDAERKASTQRRYEYLSEEKALQLVELEDKFRKLRDELGKEKFPGTAAEQKKTRADRLETLRKEQLAEQQRLLAPGEFTEFRLRQGNLTRWAESIPGFDPTPEQQRAVALARLQLSEPVDPNAPDAKEQTKAREAEKKKFEEQGLRDLLGAEGFAAYQRGRDGEYQNMTRVANRLELPQSAADEAWQVRQNVFDAVRALNTNPGLPAEMKSAAVLAIHQETIITLRRTFGADGYDAYRSIGGQWLDRIGKSASPSNTPPPGR